MKLYSIPRLLLASLPLFLVGTASAMPDAPVAIRAEVIRERITYLASDGLAGRGSGTKGNEAAAQFVAGIFKRDGLKPLGTTQQSNPQASMDGSGYFQPFTFVSGVAKGGGNRLQAVVGGKTVSYKAGTEFEPSGVSMAGKAGGEVVFVGYGIQSQDPAHDDYAGLDVKGKVVLLIAGAPGNDPHSPLLEFAGIRRKALIARDKGATGILVVLPQASDQPKMNADESPNDAGLPIIVVRQNVVSDWLKASGKADPTNALANGAPTFATGVKVTLATDVRKVVKTTANIAGLLEGSDPTLKNEVVVIGAHMDHLGMGGTGSLAESTAPAIHHGADDNASGTAGVLALADYYSSLATRPKRSLLFICFSGEELGLLGSAHYVKSPLLPLDRTAAMLNMDMIGRLKDNKLIISGSGTSPDWNPLLDEFNRTAAFTIARSESGFGASDQQSFYVAKIPVLFFFTGLHSDYHKPSDTAEKINAEGEARVVELVAQCATRIADNPTRPAYQQMVVPQDSGGARFRVSLGSIPDYAAEVEGVQLSGVRPGSPAEKAGLKGGDIIIKFGDRSIRNVQDYTIALGDHKPGDMVPIVVKRGNETLTLTATLEASKGR